MVAPSPGRVFFKDAVLQGQVGHHLLEGERLGAQIFDLCARCLTRRIPRQALLPSFEKLLRPTVIQALCNALATAQLGNTVLAAKTG